MNHDFHFGLLRHPSCSYTSSQRVSVARDAIGPAAELFVDANGAYSRKQAIAQAEIFAEHNVSWFEEPVSSDDLEGLRLVRNRVPAGMEIAAGEYGYGIFYFRRMLAAGAVDVQQADVTRCGGVTAFLQVGAFVRHTTCRSPATPPRRSYPRRLRDSSLSKSRVLS